MRFDVNWENLYFPDFTPFRVLDPEKGIMLMAADMFAPDGKFPEEVKQAVIEAVNQDKLDYVDNATEQRLKEEIAKKLEAYNHFKIDPSRNLLLTNGSAFGLFLSIRTCINPNRGDEVINFDPTFAENINDVNMMGAKNVFCKLSKENGYKFRIDDLEKCVSDHTKCVVLTHPANPIGTVYTYEEMMEFADFIKRHNLIAVVDQVFERCIYDGKEFVTLASLPGMAERTLTVFGASKELRLSGMRIGYVAGPEDLIEKMTIASANYTGKVGSLSCAAFEAAYRNVHYANEWVKRLEKRRNKCCEILNSIPKVSCEVPPAGFSIWLDIHELGSSDEIVDYLVKEANVGVGPGTWFGSEGEGFLRVMFACYNDDEKIYDACEKIAEALTKKGT